MVNPIIRKSLLSKVGLKTRNLIAILVIRFFYSPIMDHKSFQTKPIYNLSQLVRFSQLKTLLLRSQKSGNAWSSQRKSQQHLFRFITKTDWNRSFVDCMPTTWLYTQPAEHRLLSKHWAFRW